MRNDTLMCGFILPSPSIKDIALGAQNKSINSTDG